MFQSELARTKDSVTICDHEVELLKRALSGRTAAQDIACLQSGAWESCYRFTLLGQKYVIRRASFETGSATYDLRMPSISTVLTSYMLYKGPSSNRSFETILDKTDGQYILALLEQRLGVSAEKHTSAAAALAEVAFDPARFNWEKRTDAELVTHNGAYSVVITARGLKWSERLPKLYRLSVFQGNSLILTETNRRMCKAVYEMAAQPPTPKLIGKI